MLYLIGTGLGDENSLSLKSMKILNSSKRIYIENYTCKSPLNIENLQNKLNKEIKSLNRVNVETELEFLKKDEVISLLIIGTPFFATTHTQIILDAKERNIKVEVIHNSSILNIMGCYGLFSYNFGKTVSIPKFREVKFYSFFDKIIANYKNNYHTLCLLDLDVSVNYFMTPREAIDQIKECSEINNIFDKEYQFFVVGNFGCDEEKVFYKSFEQFDNFDFGDGLFSIILPAKLEIMEEEHIQLLFK